MKRAILAILVASCVSQPPGSLIMSEGVELVVCPKGEAAFIHAASPNELVHVKELYVIVPCEH